MTAWRPAEDSPDSLLTVWSWLWKCCLWPLSWLGGTSVGQPVTLTAIMSMGKHAPAPNHLFTSKHLEIALLCLGDWMECSLGQASQSTASGPELLLPKLGEIVLLWGCLCRGAGFIPRWNQ